MRVHFEHDGDIGLIRLDGPRGNPLSDPVWCDLDELRTFLADDRVKGAVVCANGPHFCVGAEPSELEARIAADPAALGRGLAAGKQLLDALWLGPVPVCAAVRGSCLGAGLELALACHFRVASTTSLFGLPESNLGLLPGLGGAVRTAARVPRSVAIDLLVSGRMLGASEAFTLGLVDELHPAARVAGAAGQLLASIVAGRTKSQVRAVMEVLATLETEGRDAALRAETQAFLKLARLSRPCGSA